MAAATTDRNNNCNNPANGFQSFHNLAEFTLPASEPEYAIGSKECFVICLFACIKRAMSLLYRKKVGNVVKMLFIFTINI